MSREFAPASSSPTSNFEHVNAVSFGDCFELNYDGLVNALEKLEFPERADALFIGEDTNSRYMADRLNDTSTYFLPVLPTEDDLQRSNRVSDAIRLANWNTVRHLNTISDLHRPDLDREIIGNEAKKLKLTATIKALGAWGVSTYLSYKGMGEIASAETASATGATVFITGGTFGSFCLGARLNTIALRAQNKIRTNKERKIASIASRVQIIQLAK